MSGLPARRRLPRSRFRAISSRELLGARGFPDALRDLHSRRSLPRRRKLYVPNRLYRPEVLGLRRKSLRLWAIVPDLSRGLGLARGSVDGARGVCHVHPLQQGLRSLLRLRDVSHAHAAHVYRFVVPVALASVHLRHFQRSVHCDVWRRFRQTVLPEPHLAGDHHLAAVGPPADGPRVSHDALRRIVLVRARKGTVSGARLPAVSSRKVVWLQYVQRGEGTPELHVLVLQCVARVQYRGVRDAT
mmetsp:Transcript_23795/g.77369  ORF Transcript_23795/g.77369 Transcript_23795/m.77369 type:complete len:244 (+) Transcript_23795:1483-2214(+)